MQLLKWPTSLSLFSGRNKVSSRKKSCLSSTTCWNSRSIELISLTLNNSSLQHFDSLWLPAVCHCCTCLWKTNYNYQFQYNLHGKKIFDKKASCQSRQPADEQCGLYERFCKNWMVFRNWNTSIADAERNKKWLNLMKLYETDTLSTLSFPYCHHLCLCKGLSIHGVTWLWCKIDPNPLLSHFVTEVLCPPPSKMTSQTDDPPY